MPRLTRFYSFLDRFDERLQVDCEQLKRQLLDQVDHRFGALRAKVAELRNRFNCDQIGPSLDIDLLFNDPPVQNVSLQEWLNEQRAAEENRNELSTSSGQKRKSSQSHSGNNNKRQKTRSTDGLMVHKCKFTGCDKTFRFDGELARHERIHLGIKPFSCTWPDCKYASEQRPDVVKHIRVVHFKLPAYVKKQNELNIEDDRDPNEFVRVDQQLVNRRL